MNRILQKCDESAAGSAGRGEFTKREVLLLCVTALLLCGFLSFAVVRAFSDPHSERSLVYFLFVVVGCFWLGLVSLCYWSMRWLAHRSNQPCPMPEVRQNLPKQREATWTEMAPDEGLPLAWPPSRQLGWGDLLAAASFLLVQALLMSGAICLGAVLGFHLHPNERLAFPSGYLILASLSVAVVLAGLVGKYLWFGVMSRWLSRAEIAPFLAYGIPRRLSRLDRKLMERFCRG